MALTAMPLAVAAGTIVFSIALGLIYPILEGRLPGLPVVKGLTFALMVWAVTSLLPSLTSPNPLSNANALSVSLLASYHPSRQNTQTGRLKWDEWLAVFRRARELLG